MKIDLKKKSKLRFQKCEHSIIGKNFKKSAMGREELNKTHISGIIARKFAKSQRNKRISTETGKLATRSNEFEDRTFECFYRCRWCYCPNWYSWYKEKKYSMNAAISWIRIKVIYITEEEKHQVLQVPWENPDR